jgi:hypothetical protein
VADPDRSPRQRGSRTTLSARPVVAQRSFSACASVTRIATDDIDVSAGNAPVWPPPTQETLHSTTAVNWNTPPGRSTEDRTYVWPQSGDPAAGRSTPDRNAVPGPRHTTLPPSPVVHLTATGWADAVADNPGTVAVALRTTHAPGATHNHVGTRTSCDTPTGGEVRITGTASTSCRYARRANCTGVGAAGACRAAVNHT